MSLAAEKRAPEAGARRSRGGRGEGGGREGEGEGEGKGAGAPIPTALGFQAPGWSGLE